MQPNRVNPGGLAPAFPEALPDFEPRDARITERAPILRRGPAGEVELVQRRWSWPAPSGKLVFNLRADAATGEAFALLTCPPGPDVAPYHDRQVALLGPPDWPRWLDPEVAAAELIGPLPAGTLACELSLA